jgi:hypothetical protein
MTATRSEAKERVLTHLRLPALAAFAAQGSRQRAAVRRELERRTRRKFERIGGRL